MRYYTALFLASALATMGVAQAQTASTVPDATQKTMNADYQSMCNAIQDPSDKNINAAFALLSPDYVETDAKGKQHKKDEIVAAARMQLKMIEADDCTVSLDSITAPDASTLVIVASQHFTGTVPGQDGKHKIDATSKSSDTWKLENGSWLQTQSKNLRNLVKIDGNVVDDEGN